jgi:hypothetical protein
LNESCIFLQRIENQNSTKNSGEVQSAQKSILQKKRTKSKNGRFLSNCSTEASPEAKQFFSNGVAVSFFTVIAVDVVVVVVVEVGAVGLYLSRLNGFTSTILLPRTNLGK